MVDFKPSQVLLGPIPLVDTMRRAERELAAAMLVYACAVLGDRWQAVPLKEVARIIGEAFANKVVPVIHWANPFLKPDPFDLCAAGYATASGETPERTIEFTEAGLVAMQRWVRAEVANG
jgi:hypothetical protein